MVSPVCYLVEVQHYCGINSQQWKKAIEINLSLRDLYEINPSSAICGAKTQISANKKSPFIAIFEK